uniref:30S ribosomal protein S5 n=2 Tax=Rhizophora mucronata TaxID=61149 RepID=A0A2P2JGB0_RHIMU
MPPKSCWHRLLLFQSLKNHSRPPQISQLSRKISTFSHFPSTRTASFIPSSKTHFSTAAVPSARVVQDLLADVEREKQREREARKRAGLDTKDIDQEDEEDYLGVGPLIEQLEKENLKNISPELLNMPEEPTDSESEDEETFDAGARRFEQFEKKHNRHKELLKNFTDAETLDDAFKWMSRIDKFEEKHFQLRPEYRVIGELMNHLKVAEGKDKFILQQKLNRAMRMMEWKEACEPNNPNNYGVIWHAQSNPDVDTIEGLGFEKQRQFMQGDSDEKEEEFDDVKERDEMLLEKLDTIDKKLEEKLAELDFTFGRKGKALEEEIRDLAEERNSLTATKRRPMYRKGFDVKLIGVNKTTKVTKGGRNFRYTALLACGNYQGVVGFAKAKGSSFTVALQKAHEKCFHDLHYIERHENHTIAHAVQTTYKKTKLYLWPASTRTGMKAGRVVQTILNLAGYKNVKSKVVGSRNEYNTVKAVFKALNAIETPKDIQEKFGRTVVEKSLLG